MPVDVVHAASEYRVKVTEPVGATAVVLVKPAVSPTVVDVPTVIDAGLATVVIPGLAAFTVSCSLLSPQDVVKALLLASPPYEASQ
jgi:hypothetical protein